MYNQNDIYGLGLRAGAGDPGRDETSSFGNLLNATVVPFCTIGCNNMSGISYGRGNELTADVIVILVDSVDR
jgi:hypothetical protein